MKALWKFVLALVPLLALTGCNYSCTSAHCYGEVQFPTTGLRGMITTLDVRNISNTGDGFVDNEMWIVDRGNTACGSQNNTCWVEAGYLADNGTVTGNSGSSGTDPHFFWADSRPNSTFIFHAFGSIPSNYFGHQVIVLILQNGTNTWDVDIQPIFIQGAPTLFATSTNNSMNPQSAEMGQELFGTNGASADPATYTVTGIKTASSTGILIPTINTDGSVTNASPPNGAWLVKPSDPNANGGKFQTKCCS
jgi:hypothetical protein